MPKTIDIAAAQVMGVLKGKPEALDAVDGESVVVCEGIDVAKVRPAQDSDGWELVAVACDHPSHGVHPKYREAAAKLERQLAEVRKRTNFIQPSAPCQKCDGSKWIKPGTPDAQMIVVLAGVVRMFRGITLGPPAPGEGGLSAAGAADTINAFLSAGGESRRVASPDPTVASPGDGRVNFSEGIAQEPQVKESRGNEREDAGDPHEPD